MKNFHWEHATAFFERVNRLNLHGLHFQHVVLCQRRAWMHLHRISFAHWNSRVALGTAKHATSHSRDHSTEGLFGLAPDRVDWKERVVYEHKGRSGARDAVSLQTAFYAAMLSIAGGKQWDGAIHVLSTRKTRKVPLDEKLLAQLWRTSEQLETLAKTSEVPPAEEIPLCAACSLVAFCGHD